MLKTKLRSDGGVSAFARGCTLGSRSSGNRGGGKTSGGNVVVVVVVVVTTVLVLVGANVNWAIEGRDAR
jgi:hypothetical protein